MHCVLQCFEFMKIIICGYNGKMGQAVKEIAKNCDDCDVVAGVDFLCTGEEECRVYEDIRKVQESADVIVDFSNPKALDSILEYSESKLIPAVICTTGFSENQFKKIKEASKNVPIFYSRNMSVGVSLLLELAKISTKILGEEFDIEIIEKHHNQKIDAPSGTAFMIAEAISGEIPESVNYVYDRTKNRAPRSKNEIGIHSVRGGTIVGEHEVIFAGDKEIITISHRAESREIFAHGAITAARFLVNQKPGLYDMKNIVKQS